MVSKTERIPFRTRTRTHGQAAYRVQRIPKIDFNFRDICQFCRAKVTVTLTE